AEDLYITLGGYDLAEGTANLKVVVNPVVDWIWFGFMLLAFGTGIALLPDGIIERLTARTTAAANASAGTPRAPGVASLALWIGVGLAAVLAPRAAHAQMAEGQGIAPDPTGPDENWLVRNIVCQCGS